MATENIYLLETVLTSTAVNSSAKLVSSSTFETYKQRLKRKLKDSCLDHPYTSTENKFLKTYWSDSLSKYELKRTKDKSKTDKIQQNMSDYTAISKASTRKKKKYRCAKRVSREREAVRNVSESEESGLESFLTEELSRSAISVQLRDEGMLCDFDSGFTAKRNSAIPAMPASASQLFGSSVPPSGANIPFSFGSSPVPPSGANIAIFGGCPVPPPGANARSFASRHMRFQQQQMMPLMEQQVMSLKMGQNLNFFKKAEIAEMPTYDFSSSKPIEVKQIEVFETSITDPLLCQLQKIQIGRSKKMQLLNVTSMSLLCAPNLKDTNDSFRQTIEMCADHVIATDPEFILKVALYSREELHIRSVSNFLLSYAAVHENTKSYLKKYFKATIRLPSDLTEVVDFCKTFDTSLPAALKNVMKKTFGKFDVYQLAKYNKKSKKSKKHFQVKPTSSNSPSLEPEFCELQDSSVKESEADNRQKIFLHSKKTTLKELIQVLHLKSPPFQIMCLLGKKYPNSVEGFKKCGLEGTWDPSLAGKRMKLPQPETWETHIPAKGNNASAWEELIDHHKLPYMAMLRNLRNLILSGLSSKHHDKIINNLQNKHAVMNSRQLPVQFFEAYKIISDIEESLNSNGGKCANDENSICFWKKRQMENYNKRLKNVSLNVLQCYKGAINKALETSILHNLHPIPGRSLVICDLLMEKCETNANKKALKLCIMISVMLFKACEDCKVKFIWENNSESIHFNELENSDFLHIVNKYYSRFQMLRSSEASDSSKELKECLEFYLVQQRALIEKVDHVIFLRLSSNQNCSDVMQNFLRKYRHLVNPELLYTDVDFSLTNIRFASSNSVDERNVYICGNNAQLVRFVAERSTGSVLTNVENIDEKYELEACKIENVHLQTLSGEPGKDVSVNMRSPKWHTVRLFISSTFKDMHSERDMLIRYVVPELQKRAASLFVKIHEIDLRWGITEADASTKRASELCLIEAQRSDLFVGLLDERYGMIYNFDLPNDPDLQWVKDLPTGLSITELEMHAGALRKEKMSQIKRRAFFYFRDHSFISDVPKEWISNFESENSESKLKLVDLKTKIVSSGAKVLLGYPCKFAGVLENKPILSGLDEFGHSVLNDLWESIEMFHQKETYSDEVSEFEAQQRSSLNNFCHHIERKNSPMRDLVKEIQNNSGIFLITGPRGIGKTAFIINLMKQLKNTKIVSIFIGLTPQSTDLSFILKYICNSITRLNPVSSVFPQLTSDIINQFPDILHEAVASSGKSEFVLIIDGLDHLYFKDQHLDWLPISLPQGLKIICSAIQPSFACKVLLGRQRNGEQICMYELDSLVQSERECLIRQYLEQFGKVLDETSFNNQLLQIVTKQDSGNPLYLKLACDFLRIYASYENFTSMLQKLPTSKLLLFREVITRMENTYGPLLVQTALTTLCITKEGLDDVDFYKILNYVLKNGYSDISFSDLVEKIRSSDHSNLLTKVTYSELVNTIYAFAYGSDGVKKLSLACSEFQKASENYYVNKNSTNFSIYLHRVLAAYNFLICDPHNNNTWERSSRSAIETMCYHLYNGKYYSVLAENLCSLKFLEAVFYHDAINNLLEYYSLILDSIEIKRTAREINMEIVEIFSTFVLKNMHILQRYPFLVMQQALNEPPKSVVHENVDKKANTVECLSQPVSSHCQAATFHGFVKNICTVSCESRTHVAYFGSEDGYLKVLDFSTKKIIRNLKSHASAITSICFTENNLICTSSSDSTLSVWNAVDYSKMFTLKGHSHNVSCCCVDPNSNILISSGWDNSVKLWSLHDGRIISTIDDFRCPVNCISHHPLKQQLSCGLWNGSIHILNTVSLKKLFVISNCSNSVKCIIYTPDGINIVSSFINSDVIIWSAEQGLKVAILKGHNLPVKSLSYSLLRNAIVSGSDDCTLKVWPIQCGTDINRIISCKPYPINLIEIVTPSTLAISFKNCEIWLMDIFNGHTITKLNPDPDVASCFSRFLLHACFSSDVIESWVESHVIFGAKSGKIMIGNLKDTTISCFATLDSMITAIVHNNNFIFCGNSEGDIGIFSYPAGCSQIVNGAHKISLCALNLYIKNEELWAMSSANDRILYLWKITQPNIGIILHEKTVSKHNDIITACCWYPNLKEDGDNFKFLTGSQDNNVILHTEKESVVYTGLSTSVLHVDFNDNFILGCGIDGSIAIWSKDASMHCNIPGIQQSSLILSFFICKDSYDEFDVTFAFLDKDNSIRIQKPIKKTYQHSLEGHSKSIASCCSTENEEIVSSSLDGTVTIWKIPEDNFESIPTHHSCKVSCLILVPANNLVLSSDVEGKIYVWEMKYSSNSEIICVAKKIFNGGYIKSLAWLKHKQFVCAVQQLLDEKEKHFLSVLSLESSNNDGDMQHNIHTLYSYYFDDEISCLDANPTSETIIAGFKSGNFVIYTPSLHKTFQIHEDWISGAKIIQCQDSVEYVFTCSVNGQFKRFEISRILESNKEYSCCKTFNPNKKGKDSFNTAFYCTNQHMYCGDTDGYLKIYSEDAPCFQKKIHDDAITCISTAGPYFFTSSIDKTVKGWDNISFKQVCQFHSSTPVTCMVSQNIQDISLNSLFLLTIGTSSGEVHLLKFHPS